MFNKKCDYKNRFMLTGKFAKKGYDWWWHSFTGIDRQTGAQKPFFIEYFIINPKLSPDKIIYGNKEKKPCYMMIKCGSWGENKSQLHRFFKLNDVKINKCPIEITADDCYLSTSYIKGSVDAQASDITMSDTGTMSWDLKITKDIAYNVGYGTSKICQALKAFQMYWHAEGMKSTYSGTVTYNGKIYDIIPEKSYGYQDKNWGSDFTSPWVWLSSNNIYDKKTGQRLENSVFDIGGGRPKVYFIPFKRKLLGAYYIEGKEYEYNFSKFLHPSKTEFNYKLDNEYLYWYVKQSNRKTMIITEVKCKLDDMLFVRYEQPNGKRQHNKLYNGGNGEANITIFEKRNGKYEAIRELLCYNLGCEYGEFGE